MAVGVHEPNCSNCGAHYAEGSYDDKGRCPECSPTGGRKAAKAPNLDDMTKAELVDMAKGRGVAIAADDTKADIIKALNKAAGAAVAGSESIGDKLG